MTSCIHYVQGLLDTKYTLFTDRFEPQTRHGEAESAPSAQQNMRCIDFELKMSNSWSSRGKFDFSLL